MSDGDGLAKGAADVAEVRHSTRLTDVAFAETLCP
jgi:hypothetical protein